ncbi:hypothetical protein ACIOG9_35730, partial [Streptomyces sp. NPDC088178]
MSSFPLNSFAARAAVLALLAATATGCSLPGSDSDAADAQSGPSFTVAAAGDILIHPQLTEQARKDAESADGKGAGSGGT